MKVGQMLDLPRENARFYFQGFHLGKQNCDFTWPKLGIYVDCCMIARTNLARVVVMKL